MRLRGRGKAFTFDRAIEVRIQVPLVRVPLRQAILNLLKTCFGSPGLPEGLLHLVASGNFRAVVRRWYGGIHYMSALLNVRYAGWGVELRAHGVPACTEALVSHANTVLSRAASWGRSAAVVCQVPTPALWDAGHPVHSFFAKKLKYADGPPYYPSAGLLDSLLRELLSAEGYPFVYAVCADGDLSACGSEALLVVADEHLSSLLYAFNASVAHPDARVSVRVESPGVVRVGGEPTSLGAEEGGRGG